MRRLGRTHRWDHPREGRIVLDRALDRADEVDPGIDEVEGDPQLFLGLTAQFRLFIAAMGLDYAYSIPGMCHDDTALMERIRTRDETGAVRIWHRKIDDAVTYMTTQLPSASGVRYA